MSGFALGVGTQRRRKSVGKRVLEKGARTTPWKPAALLNAGSGKVSLKSTDDRDLLFIFSHPLPISTGILPWKSWAGLCDWSQCPAARRAFSLVRHPLMWRQQNSPQVLGLHPLSCLFVIYKWLPSLFVLSGRSETPNLVAAQHQPPASSILPDDPVDWDRSQIPLPC